jgi:lysine 2,3-aminomutase
MTKPLSSLKSADDLVAAGLVPESERAAVSAVGLRYAIAITPTIAALIDGRDAADPIARQFVPSAAELHVAPQELADPIGDNAHSPVNGVVHRYPDRVLLKLASVCPVYCRFCFRREMVGKGEEAALSGHDLGRALDYIRATPAVFEVIVTGGDPLVLSPRRIAEVTRALSEIRHVAVIRWHTRVPVVAPERITRELIAALSSPSKAVYVALHTNHPREIGVAAREAIRRLVEGGIAMVSQTVLLSGVNDDADVLDALFRALLANRVKPYYLHHGDLAPGTSHLRTSIGAGQDIMRSLRGRLSGLALPAYVLDIPGGYGKVPIDADHVGPRDPATGAREVRDTTGRVHVYID